MHSRPSITPTLTLPRLLAALAVVAGLLGPALPGGAATSTAERRRELQDELLEVTQDEARLALELQGIEEERRRLDAHVAELDGQVALSEQRLAAAEETLSAAIAEAQAAAARLQAVTRKLRKAEGVLRDQAVTAFIRGGNIDHLNSLLASADLRELDSARVQADVVIEHQDRIVDEVERLRRQAAGLSRRAASARDEAAGARRVAETERNRLQTDRAAVIETRSMVESASARHELLLAEVRSRKASYEAQLAAMAAVSSAIGTLLRDLQSSQQVAAATRGTLSPPLLAARVTSPFGPRLHPIYGDVRVHTGIDFGAANGTPILASGNGTVLVAGDQGGYGTTVVIDHGNGLATLYAHQSALAVHASQTVAAGDVIGSVGSTGNSTGPHLHFEVRVQGTPVDPMFYL